VWHNLRAPGTALSCAGPNRALEIAATGIAVYSLQDEHDVALHPAQELEDVRTSPDSPFDRNPKTEKRLFTRRLWQPGHATPDESSELATSSSKGVPHFRQSYSYIGMMVSLSIAPSEYQNAEGVPAVSRFF
jgi:hypothetical protein